MKILYYSPHPNLALQSDSGYGTHMREMIRSFKELGHEVKPYVVGGMTEGGESAKPGISSIRRIAKNSVKSVCSSFVLESLKDGALLWRDRHYERKLAEQVQEVDPDLIYERAAYLQLSGLNVAEEYEIPHILEMNSPYLVERKLRTGTHTVFTERAQAIEREQLERTQVATVVSEALVDYFSKEHDLPRSSIHCVPNGINPDSVSFKPRRVQEIENTYGLRKKFVVGFVGALSKYQRVDLLVKAVADLVSDHSNVELLIVGGGGGERPRLRRLSQDLDVADHVSFTGRVPHSEVFDFIKVMDVAVLPDNLWYGCPTKVFEYGAMGTPTLVPDTVTMRNLFEGGSEVVFADSSAESITSALTKLIKRPEWRQELADSVKSKVLTTYTWERSARRVLRLAKSASDFDGG